MSLPTPPSENLITPRSNVKAKDATVYIHSAYHPKSVEYARTKFKKVILLDDLPLEETLEQTEGIFLRMSSVSREMILKSPKLQIISRNGVGYDNVHIQTCKEKGIIVTNVPGGNAHAVAELALGMMLDLLRRISEVDRKVRLGEKIASINVLAPGLFYKTIGLIGMGNISWELSKLLSVFKCKILIYSPTSSPNKWQNSKKEEFEFERISSLEELIKQVDVLSIHCPLNDSTKNLISKNQLNLMKSNSIIINTARGGIINERDLEFALINKKIWGAALDVWEIEPSTNKTMGKLAELENTVVLPHLGGATEEVAESGCTESINIMADYFDGKGIKNRVV
ncbi:uncharacterized protein L201_006034 [Kwoniella dendrophila CBS 6074]|uniref:Phosphoglycerate dehydrogenase n=1 Tax=Kwoniella dendrophila CBS 6074 TaxID=1295534 RepID=A0AAX4K2X9_9TREE